MGNCLGLGRLCNTIVYIVLVNIKVMDLVSNNKGM